MKGHHDRRRSFAMITIEIWASNIPYHSATLKKRYSSKIGTFCPVSSNSKKRSFNLLCLLAPTPEPNFRRNTAVYYIQRKPTSQVLVLTAQGLCGIVGLLQLCLHTEELGAVATGLLLGVLQLRLKVVHLSLPFRDRLVESALLLFQVVGISVGLRIQYMEGFILWYILCQES